MGENSANMGYLKLTKSLQIEYFLCFYGSLKH